LILEDFNNPFSGAMYRAVEDLARARAVTVLAGSCDKEATRACTLVSAFVS
jgi:DNA-binding LacI/PurR family transcriptional regulator